MDTHYLLFIGIAYLFIAGVDLMHALAYKGMGVFPADSNLATQLWIAGCYLQSLSLLMAPLFIRRKLQPAIVSGFFDGCRPPSRVHLHWRLS